jgi:UDP-N-acetylmuramyl pentapeptide phosphotransferase/UDP-N-acetylglucosamine-1-phosphate transferase
MILLNSEIFTNNIIPSSAILFLIVYFVIKLTPNYLGSFFGKCVSNDKTSKFHLPMIRGIGIIFAIVLILSSILWGSVFSIFEIIIISLSTLIGFWDDKYGLRQKQKLFFFMFIGCMWSFYNVDFVTFDIYFFLNFILYVFIFVFLVLFFNQIDGINGLASGTFLTCLLFIYLTGTNLMLLLPIILSVLAYLVINMNGKIGIQGDAGSFFMGSFIAILYTKSTEWNELGLVFFILGPIVFDVCATSIIKVFYKINLTIGHKDNLYQKLVSKYQSHFLITSIFVFLQFLFCFWLSVLLEKNSLVFIYYILFFICSLLMLFFCFVAYLIYNKKILK